MPRRRRESSPSSESSSSEDDGPPQEPWLINQQKCGGYVVIKSGNRRYDEWCGLDKHGETVTYPGNGAYFPEGYQPNWDQAKPFRCPITNCELAFEFPYKVGNHFRQKHRKALLFDTRNGRFNVIGRKRVPTDKENRNGRRKWAPVVVRRAPNPGWQAVAQAQQVQAQQAAPAPVVQPAIAAAAQPAPQLNAAPQPPAAVPAAAPVALPAPAQFANISPRRRRPPLAARRAARQASAPAAIQGPIPQLPLPAAPVRDAASSPLRRLQPLQPLPPLPEIPPAAIAPENNRALLSQRSATLYASPIWTYLLALLPRPTPDFPVPKDAALHTFLTFPRRRALPTVWRDRLKQHPTERPLTMKQLTTIAWYLGARKSRTPTPCGTEGCPVHVLVNSFRELGRDENGRRKWSEKSRFEEITCEFNTPHPDPDRRVVRKEMGFPRCVAGEIVEWCKVRYDARGVIALQEKDNDGEWKQDQCQEGGFGGQKEKDINSLEALLVR
ncbi:hypothetical protein NEUTE1DRAFT_34323 [Neurospora tetrasperma FGSC 2508]|uniref:C2H2-type domain-containing protein n=1 Tax=Neurospora tetrasperma (strain FGSC 2508 / ATCC MYA-4615 / P0657) TaxID=510951 RepID=F8MEP3_NEUT8|nr:uncharacterized protein NEUTE1DRAFT_34323 [Neurospora tetrasperma FGSC 2508]EGO61672.1 hypothetical protein NEUTE1DRAFT_34323 [Neurospora tetrasperma FGSC 2508]EGZ74277.1 hypothetical protein NEUTE2DRAFT_57928 [Neurospora tetrasperma FGSC 2509]